MDIIQIIDSIVGSSTPSNESNFKQAVVKEIFKIAFSSLPPVTQIADKFQFSHNLVSKERKEEIVQQVYDLLSGDEDFVKKMTDEISHWLSGE